MSKHRKVLNAREFIDGLTRMRQEDLRRKYKIPANIDPDLLVAVLTFMEKGRRREVKQE